MTTISWVLFGLTLVWAVQVDAANGKSQFSPFEMATVNADGTFIILRPIDTIIVLYTDGSESNSKLGPCRPMAGAGSLTYHLAGTKIAGKSVLVHGYSSRAKGGLPKQSMAEARAPDLERIIEEYHRQGVPPAQVFVSGFSMGGWTALLVGVRKKVEIGGFIAFSPANGVWTKDRRGPQHDGVVARQRTAVANLNRLDGMVFSIYGDPYNSPSDLEHLAKIPGIEFLTSEACSADPHGDPLYDCFRVKFVDQVRAYIEARTLASMD